MGSTNCLNSKIGKEEKAFELNGINKRQNTVRMPTQKENHEKATYNSINNNELFRESKKICHTKNEKSEIYRIKSVMYKAPTLYLEVINSPLDPKGLTLKISPLGLINGKRNAEDGFTYFGYEKEEDKLHSVDYLITPKDDIINENFYGKHFQIRFDPIKIKYYLKDLGKGNGSFIKINDKIQIKKNMLFCIGENYLVFTLGKDGEIITISEEKMDINTNNNSKWAEDSITVTIFTNKSHEKKLSFFPMMSPISVGRSSECQIIIDDNLLSRVHCTIEFKEGKWYIIDGMLVPGKEVKKSTNGTWEYSNEETEITEKMMFKANHSLFICNFHFDNESESL